MVFPHPRMVKIRERLIKVGMPHHYFCHDVVKGSLAKYFHCGFQVAHLGFAFLINTKLT